MNLFSISPHQPFLPTLCRQLMAGKLVPGFDFVDPMVLARTRIYLPTERARRALGKELATQLGGIALLPQIRTFGAIDEIETSLLGIGDHTLQPAISPLKRQLVLTQLIHRWVAIQNQQPDSMATIPPNLSEAVNLAGSLAELMDRFETEQVSMDGLTNLVPDDYQQNWQLTLQFLEIIRSQWPAFLNEQNLLNPADRRNQMMASEIDFLKAGNITGPVIAAGSTGSVPATAALLKTIATMDNGAVILPGFNTALIASDWAAILDDKAPEPSHPQFGLGTLLGALEAQPDDVVTLEAGDKPPLQTILTHAFAPASQTDLWVDQAENFAPGEITGALENMTIIEAANEEEEARIIALIMREASQSETLTALVTPQRTLARRVSNELARWGINVDDTAGSPLREASASRYCRLLIELCASQFDAINLLAVLRNRLTCLGLSRAQIISATLLLEEKLLRGPRVPNGLAGLRAVLETYRTENAKKSETSKICQQISQLLDALESVFAPLTTREDDSDTLAGWARLLVSTLEAATKKLEPETSTRDFSTWDAQLEGAPELITFLEALASESPNNFPVDLRDLRPLLESLFGTSAVHRHMPSHPTLFIWGPLEARLQNLDRVILAGLSETVWPQAIETGPWLSRHMQAQLGLAPPERFIGLAAHDIESALAVAGRGGEVFLTRSKSVEGSPKTTSRWLQRLTTFVGENADPLFQRGQYWLDLSNQIDAVDTITPAKRPAPCPPANQRPRRLSVTDAETLFRDPYAFYAKHTLALRPLDPIGGEPDFRERGQIMHKIFERFVEKHDLEKFPFDSPQALQAIIGLAEQELARLDAFESLQALWRKRFGPIAVAYLNWETARAQSVEKRFTENTGSIKFTVAGEQIELLGRADRLDKLHSGQVEIIDFKTGTPPRAAEVCDLWAPQLPLEGLLLVKNGFDNLAPTDNVSFNYIKISHGPEPFNLIQIPLKDEGSPDLIERAHQQLSRQIEALLLRDDLPFVSNVAPRPNQNFVGDYDHLARLEEWSQGFGEADL